MRNLLLLLLVCVSCATTKVRPKRITIEELKNGNQLYSVKDNSYFYFMIDSVGNKHLVKTHMFNSQKVIWTEKLTRR
jgi:hypothetical protein